jgi:hypothetical protein
MAPGDPGAGIAVLPLICKLKVKFFTSFSVKERNLVST